jgi:small redox-active disulfide protein 2
VKIQILGTGCAKCKQLAQNAEAAAQQLGVEYEIEKITEISDIVAFGVMRTPALAVDGQVKLSGYVPSPTDLQQYLR